VITQSGTDTSLAGLTGLAGVSVIGVDTKVYRLSGAKLSVTGSLTITPISECLLFDETCPQTELTVQSATGALTIGAAKSIPWAVPAVTFLRKSPSLSGLQLAVVSGGTLAWHYGTISTRGSVLIESTAGGCVLNGALHLGNTGDQPGRLLLNRAVTFGPYSTVTGNGIEMRNGATVSAVTIADALSIGLHASAFGSLTAPYVVQDVRLLGTSSVYPWGAAVWHLKAMAGGGAVLKSAGGQSAGTSAFIQTYGRANLSLTAGGAPVAGAAIISRDTNNGARTSFVCGTDNATFNGVPDTTVTATTAADGTTGVQEYLLQNWSRTPAGVNTVDWRTLAAGANTRRVYVSSYAHRITSTVLDMTAAGTLAQPVFLDADPSVSRTKASAQTLSQVGTLDDVYDLAKLWRTTPGNLEYPSAAAQPVVTSGTDLDLGALSLVLDPSAAQAFALTGNTITVKGTTLAAGIKHLGVRSTGTVTAAGAGSVSAPIVDANGDSFLSFEGIDSWAVYSDAARTVQIGAGVSGQGFRFVYASGTTYYLRCVAGSTEFAMVANPAAAGVTTVSLSTSALLTSLQGAVAAVKADTGLIKVAVL
jgi:hypothetical protein